VTVAGFSETVGPFGETELTRFTVFVNPARLVRLTVEFVDDPGVTERLIGLAET
jgi:hypothetical protein